MRTATWLGLFCMLASTAASAAPKAKKASKPEPVEVAEDEEEEEEGDEEEGEEEEEAVAQPEVVVRETPKPRKTGREFYFRAGIAHVEPRTKSGGMVMEPAGITKLVPMPPVQGGIVTDPANVFTAILGFAPATFRGYVSFETLIGIPKSAKLRATGNLANMSLAPTALGLVDTGIPPLGEELGEASAAPLMLTVVARTPAYKDRVRAYIGAGPSVLIVRNAKVTNKVLTEVATPKIEITPAVGFVAQVGVDVKLYKRLHARLDIKEMWFQPSESRITNIHVKTTIPLLETVNVGSARSTVQANPLIVQFGIGASF
jgi:hypothetical protein